MFKSPISIVFYDLTTIYFESQQTDALRRYGYSKDNKTGCVQVVIGLVINHQEKLNIFTDEIFDHFQRIRAVTLNAFKERVVMRTEITDENNMILRSLGIKIPPVILEKNVVE